MRSLPPASRAGIPARTRVVFVEPESSQSGSAGASALPEYIQAIKRSRLLLLLTVLVGAGVGCLISLPDTPDYTARTAVELLGSNENLLNTRDVDPELDNRNSDSYLQTQVRILQSRSLILRTLRSMNLESRKNFQLPTSRLWKLEHLLGLPAPTEAERRASLVRSMATSVKVKAQPGSRIVEISCSAADPRIASEFLNTLTSEYMAHVFALRNASTKQTSEWLMGQVEGLRKNLIDAEGRLQRYAQSNQLLFTSEKESVQQSKLRQLQEELAKAQADRVAAQSEYAVAGAATAESVPQVLSNERLSSYQQKLTELRREYAELNASMTPEHPKIKRVQAQISEMQTALENERKSILQGITNRYRASVQREKMLADAYAQQMSLVAHQGSETITYDMLRREVETNRTLYESMMQHLKEANVAWALQANHVRVIEPAEPPSGAQPSTVWMDTTEGALAGCVLGIVIVLMKQRADQSFRAPGDSAHCLQLPELGVIPSVQEEMRDYTAIRERRKTTGLSLAEANNGHKPGGEVSLALATWNSKPSLLAESFRATLTSLLCLESEGQQPRVIVVTSPGPQEGKTVVTSNLGTALSESNRRVLLIDADLRRPQLHNLFNLPNTWGLSDLLRETAPIENWPLEALVKKTDVSGIYVLPSGPAIAKMTSLFYSDRMAELLRRFRREFSAVLIDTPPMLSVADARVLSKLADGTILVIRAGHTARHMAAAATQRLIDDGTPVLGTVLNDWRPSDGRYYGYTYYTAAGQEA